MKLYILRHGETEYNRMGIVQGSGVDTDLNDIGREQARAFYEHYQDIEFELVVTSALKRTHQTVAHFIDLDLPWHITPDINEISWGESEGKKPNDHWKDHWDRVRTSWNLGDLSARLPGGESAAELNDRLLDFLAWVKERPEKQILVCCHGRTLRGLIALMKGVTLADMEGNHHSNTGCYIAEFREGQFHFLAENSLEHLEKQVI